MNRNIDRHKRYFNGQYSKRDYSSVKGEFETPNNPSFISKLHEHWMEFSLEDAPEIDMNPILHRIQNRIFRDQNPIAKQVRFILQLQRIAAILFIPLLLSGLIYFYFENQTGSAWAEIQCPNGVRTQFKLPDGSTGYLNSGSTLKYVVKFSNDRSVKLKGEAFFDVVHNKKSPFHVITSNLDVEVLGTRFNVTAFGSEKMEEVTLLEGSVEISVRDEKNVLKLQPDQQFHFDGESRKNWINKVDASQYLLWTEGKLRFRGESFINVANRLSRWYNVNFEIGDKRLNKYLFYATFENEKLEDVVKLIELSAPIKCQIMEREMNVDGSFKQKKIMLILIDCNKK